MADKHFIFVCFILLSFTTFGQKRKITPKQGEIIFTSTEVITDQKLLTQSYLNMTKKMMSNLKSAIKEEKLANGDNVDTALAESITDSLGYVLPELLQKTTPIIEHRFVYKNSTIEYHTTQNGVTSDFFTLIDPINSTSALNIATDTLKENGKPEPFKYSENRNFSIKEFRDERKTISGFICFKVIYTYKRPKEEFNEDISSSEKEFLNYISNFTYYKEFWVTEEIQSLFHPVCKDKEILTKYYPLQVKEYNEHIKGAEQVHLLKSISISE